MLNRRGEYVYIDPSIGYPSDPPKTPWVYIFDFPSSIPRNILYIKSWGKEVEKYKIQVDQIASEKGQAFGLVGLIPRILNIDDFSFQRIDKDPSGVSAYNYHYMGYRFYSYLTDFLKKLSPQLIYAYKQTKPKKPERGIMAGDDDFFPLNYFWEFDPNKPLNGAYKTQSIRLKNYKIATENLQDTGRSDKLVDF